GWVGGRARAPPPGSARRGDALRGGGEDRTLRDRARGAALGRLRGGDLSDSDGGGLLRPGRAGGARRRIRRAVSSGVPRGPLPAVAEASARGRAPHHAELRVSKLDGGPNVPRYCFAVDETRGGQVLDG